jgi:hypothetical protein
MRRREEQAASIGEQELLHPQVGHAEHQHVVEPLAGVRIDGVTPAAPMARDVRG